MASNEREVKYKLTGDVSELTSALSAAESELDDLGKVGKSITVLENALESVRRFETELTVADAKVRQLKATLSEAYASGADAPQLKALERELAAAERTAARAEKSLQSANAEVVRLNLEAGKTGVSTSNLAAKQAELAAEVGKVQAKMAALAEQTKKTAASEEAAAAKAGQLNQAFSTLNFRSASQINADILQINQALGVLARNAKISGDDFGRAFGQAQAQISRLRAELHAANNVSEKSSGFIGSLRESFSGLKGVLSALGIGSVVEKFLEANLAADKLDRALTAITGSSKAAATDIKFLRQISNELGLSFESVSQGFIKFSAATKGTGLEGQKTRDIFVSVADAMARLGLNAEEQGRAFNSLGQMISKGTVASEELKGQLGDVLPGAFQVAARAVGLTTDELGKLMDKGGLVAETFLPRFAAELKKTFSNTGPIDGLSAAIERIKNQWTEAASTIGKNGLNEILGGPLMIVNGLLMGLANALNIVVVGVTAFTKSIGVLAAALISLDFSGLKQSFRDIGNEAYNNLDRFARLTQQSIGLGDASKRLADEVHKAADGTKKAGSAASEAGPSFEKLQLIYQQVADTAKTAAETSVKAAEAKKAEGEASIAIANAFGTEKEKREAAAAAAAANAAAADEVAKARQREFGIAQAYLIQVEHEIEMAGKETEAQSKLKKQLTENVAERVAMAEKANAQAQASALVASQAQAEAAAHADNSSRVNELRLAYEQARAAVADLKEQKAGGVEVTAKLAEAERVAGAAALLYRDALSDQIEKIKALNDQKQAAINLESTGIKLQIEQLKTIAEVAKVRGDERTVMEATLQIKQLEIQLAELTGKAKMAEADAAMMAVQAKREELKASGQLTPAKEAELKAQEAAANVKKLEGEIALETADRMRQLADETENSARVSALATDGFSGLAASLDGVSSSADRATSAVSRVGDAAAASSSASGRAAKSSNEWVRQENVSAAIAQEIRSRGLSPEVSQAAIAKVDQYFAEEAARMENTGTSGRYGAMGAIQGAINRAIERAIIDSDAQLAQQRYDEVRKRAQQTNQSPAAQTGGGFQIDTQQQPARQQPQAQSGMRIEINIGGKPRTVNVASKSDADALAAILRELEDAAGRAY